MKLFFFGIGGALNAAGVIAIGRFDDWTTLLIGCACISVGLPLMIACR